VLTEPRVSPAEVANFATPAANTMAAGLLMDFGLALHRSSASSSTAGSANAALAPVSAATALALVHAGTAGPSQREIGLLLGSAAAPHLGMTRLLPGLLQSLVESPAALSPWTMVNRVWVDDAWKDKVQPVYRNAVQVRFNGSVIGAPFEQPPAAVEAINTWVSEATRGLVPTLVSESVLKPDTRVVVTNAVHFKSPWAQTFDPSRTLELPFGPGARPVPTMVDERTVMATQVNGAEVYELPFRGDRFSLLVALPPAGLSLQGFTQELSSLEVSAWRAALVPRQCLLQLPKFSIAARGATLRPALQALGMVAAFGPGADFKPMLGAEGLQVQLSDVVHSASLTIDETGGEAAAATAAVLRSRMGTTAMPCAIDRPFIYMLLHRPTGAPLFIGHVTDPAAR
jgi:serpin B